MEETDKKTLEGVKAEMLKDNAQAQRMLEELAKKRAELDKKAKEIEGKLIKLKERK
jgi:hypothetical protein